MKQESKYKVQRTNMKFKNTASSRQDLISGELRVES